MLSTCIRGHWGSSYGNKKTLYSKIKCIKTTGMFLSSREKSAKQIIIAWRKSYKIRSSITNQAKKLE